MKKHVMVVKYILYDLLHSLKHSGRLKFQLTLTLCIGMFFPLLCFGCFYASMLQFSTLPLVEEERVLTIMLQGESQRPAELLDQLKADFPSIEQSSIVSYRYSVVEWSGERSNRFVRYATPSLLDFIQITDVSGRPILSDAQKLCIAENSWPINVEPGQSITVEGVEYHLSSRFTCLRNSSNLYLPYPEGKSLSNLMQHEIYLRGSNLPNEDTLIQWLKNTGLNVTAFQTGKDSSSELLVNCFKSSVNRMAIGLIGLLYAAINVGLVIIGKLQNEKRSLGIRMAVGASYKMICLSVFSENVLCLMAALVGDICIMPFILLHCPTSLAIKINPGVYLASFMFCLVVLVVSTWISTWKLKKIKPIRLMERVS